MEERNSALRRASLVMIGTIIGAGIFALPAMFDRVGFWPATILFWFLAAIVSVTHVFYVDVVLSETREMRLAGFAQRHLGAVGHWIAAWTYPLQIVGVNFAYILLGGEFLSMLARFAGFDLPMIGWQMLFWLFGAVTVFYGLKAVAKVEVFATWLLVSAVLLASLLALDRLEVGKLAIADWSAGFLPFGVFLFALSGINVIPEVVKLVGRHRVLARQAVLIGTLVSAALSWFFGCAIAFATQGMVGRSPADLLRALPEAGAWLIPVVGLLAVATSYLTTAQDLKATLKYDFGVPKLLAWMAALFVPFGLLMVLKKDFLSLIDVIGTVFGGINGVLIALIAMRIYERRRVKDWRWEVAIPAFVMMAYLCGVLYKLLA